MSRTYRRNSVKYSKFVPLTQSPWRGGRIDSFTKKVMQGRDGALQKDKVMSVVEDRLNTWDTGGYNFDTAKTRRRVRSFYNKKLRHEMENLDDVD